MRILSYFPLFSLFSTMFLHVSFVFPFFLLFVFLLFPFFSLFSPFFHEISFLFSPFLFTLFSGCCICFPFMFLFYRFCFPVFLLFLFPMWPQVCIVFAFLVSFYCSLIAFFPMLIPFVFAFFSDSGLQNIWIHFGLFPQFLLFPGFPKLASYRRHNCKVGISQDEQ